MFKRNKNAVRAVVGDSVAEDTATEERRPGSAGPPEAAGHRIPPSDRPH